MRTGPCFFRPDVPGGLDSKSTCFLIEGFVIPEMFTFPEDAPKLGSELVVFDRITLVHDLPHELFKESRRIRKFIPHR
jgi:hypothetical protein